MRFKKGVVHLLPIFLILIIIVAVYLLITKFVFKKKIPLISTQEPTVELRTEYKNPFDKNTQYVNPFDQYKSSFNNLR